MVPWKLNHLDSDIEAVAEFRARELVRSIVRLEGAADLPRVLFLREAVERVHGVVVKARAEREDEPLTLEEAEKLGESIQASVDRRGVQQVLLRSEEGVPILLSRGHSGNFEISVAAVEESQATEIAELTAATIRIEPEPRDPRVSVAFWSGASDPVLGSPSARWRRLALPPFAAIEGNYPAEVRRQLDGMCSQTNGAALPGRLALWHGPPGTGKTWALRALGREWNEWCDLHYITDPERLLGGDTSYLLGVLAARSESVRSWLDDDEDDDPHPDDSDRWRLLVLEDAGELLGVAAPTEVGRGFARLLNIVDGLLGQGSQTLILVTTNEPLGKLHPAALRPGRAMATVEFGPLSPAEATTWLQTRQLEHEVQSPITIAELHAMHSGGPAGSEAAMKRPAVGFG